MTKALNLLLAAAIVSSAIVMPVSVSAETVVYEQNVEDTVNLADTQPAERELLNEDFSYENIDEMTAAGWWFEGTDSENFSKMEDGMFRLGLGKGGDNRQAKHTFDPATSGTLTMEWDVATSEYTNAIFKVWGNGGESVFPVYFNPDDSKISVNGTPGTAIGDYIPGETYHCTLVIDMDSKNFAVTVTNAQNEEVASGNFDRPNAKQIEEITLQTWQSGKFNSSDAEASYVGFDNLIITNQENPIRALPINEEFNYSNIDEMTAAGWAMQDPSNNVSEITDNALRLGLNAGQGEQRAKRTFTPVKSGVLTAEWDITPAEPSVYIYFWGNKNEGDGVNNGRIHIMYFDQVNKKIYFNTNGNGNAELEMGAYTPGETYHCEVTADLDDSLLTVTVTDKDGGTVGTRSRALTYTEIQEFTFQIWGSSAEESTYVTIDNFSVTRGAAEPDPEPTEPVQTTAPSAEPTEPVQTTEPSAEPTEPVQTTEPSAEPTEEPAGPAKLPFSETFDYADIADMKAAGWDASDDENDISEIDNGVFRLGLKADVDNQQYTRKIEEVNSGVLKIEYDVTPAEGVCAYLYTHGSGRTPVFFFQNGQIRIGSTQGDDSLIGSYTNDVTYHCSAELNFSSNTITAEVTSGGETVAEGTKTGINSMVNQITLQTWASPANDTWVGFDNLAVTHEAGAPDPTPTADPEFEEIIYENSFDGVGTLDELSGQEGSGWNRDVGGRQPGLGNDGVIVLREDGANKYLYVNHTTDTLAKTDTICMSYDYPAVTNGQVIYDFDIMTDRTNIAFMRFGYQAHMDYSITPDGEIYNSYWTGEKRLLTDETIQPDRWYHAVITADLTSDYSTLYIEDKETGETIVDVDIPVIGNHTLTRFEIAITDTAKTNMGGAYLDNLKITRTMKDATDPRPLPGDETPAPSTEPTEDPAGPAQLPFSETFDYADMNAMKAAGWEIQNPNDDVSKVENGVFMLGLKAQQDEQRAKRNIEPVTSGVLTAEWDVTPADGVSQYTYFWGNGNNGKPGTINSNIPVMFFDNGGKQIHFNSNGTRGTVIGAYTPGQTYHCRAVADFNNSTLTVTVTNVGGSVVGTASGNVGYNEIQELTFQTWSKPANDTWTEFDNVSITHEEKSPEKLPINDAFDYADMDEMKAAGWQAAYPDADISKIEDGAFKLGLKAGEDNQQYVRNFEEVVSGIIHIEYDVTPAEGVCAYVWTGSARTPVFYFYDGNIRIGSTSDENAIIGTYTDGATYHCSAELNLYNNTITAKVTQGDETVAEGTRSGINPAADQIVLQIWASPANDTWVAFDNLSITREEVELPPLDETFDSYEDIDAMRAAGWNVVSGYNTSKPGPNSEESAIVGEGEDKAFYLGIDANTDNIQAIRSLNTPIEQGRARLEFDVIPGADTLSYVWMSGTGEGANSGIWNGNRFSLIVFTGGQIGIGASRFNEARLLGNYTAGQEYHCSVVIDLENDTLTAEVESADGTLIGSETVDYKSLAGTDMFTLTGLTLQEWGAAANTGSTFDNITVAKVPEDAPVVSIGSTTFVTDGEESSNYREVSTLTDSIAVNFGAVMDPETITGIKVINSADGSEAAYTAEIDGYVVNLNLTRTLAPNAEYTIVIPAEAANVDGTALGEEARLVFNTVNDVEYNGAIKALTIDGNAVTNISQIKAGTTLAADVKLDNATSENEHAVVIFSFYDENNTLVKTSYEAIELNAGAKFNDTVEYTVDDMTDVKTVKVMLWDGFENIRALDGCTTID